MVDYAKFVAFPVAGVSGYTASLIFASRFTELTGLSEVPSQLVLVGLVALVSGLLFDDVIPGYIRYVRQGDNDSSGSVGGLDGDEPDIDLD